MREILFRGKRVDSQTWVEGSLLSFMTDDNISQTIICPIRFNFARRAYPNTDLEIGFWHQVIAETVGQYTGLTDKKGMKIFEGDIIRYTNHVEDIYHEEIGVCVYEQNECNFCLQRKRKNPKNYPVPVTTDTIYLISNVDYEAYYEVIGNIHDNPELLEVNQNENR